MDLRTTAAWQACLPLHGGLRHRRVALYQPALEADYVSGAGADTRVLWGAVSELVLVEPSSAAPSSSSRSSGA